MEESTMKSSWIWKVTAIVFFLFLANGCQETTASENPRTDSQQSEQEIQWYGPPGETTRYTGPYKSLLSLNQDIIAANRKGWRVVLDGIAQQPIIGIVRAIPPVD